MLLTRKRGLLFCYNGLKMKTTYTPEDVQQFLETTEHANPDSIAQLSEGHISQALAFETVDGTKQVLRISAIDEDFRADEYAFKHFGDSLPIPAVREIGNFGDGAYYCISDYVPGTTSNKLSQEDMQAALDAQNDVFARIFSTDVSATQGYGGIDLTTGNAKHDSWKAVLTSELEDMDVDKLRQQAQNIGLDPTLVDKFVAQFNANLPYASEVRHLLHGDMGFDNLIVDEGKVTAVIDWAQMGYGDWLHDYSKFDFWWPDRYTSPQVFADRYDLDAEHIPERIALYWAYTVLGNISFADRFKSEKVTEWLHEHAEERLI